MSAEEILRTQVIEKAWKDPAFKERLLSSPKAAIQEALGIVIPEHVQLKAVAETSNQLYLVIPQNPAKVLDGNPSVKAMW